MEINSPLANEVISMVTNEKSPIDEIVYQLHDIQYIDEIIYQLRDIQYDLEMYDPNYGGYHPIHDVLQKLHNVLQKLQMNK